MHVTELEDPTTRTLTCLVVDETARLAMLIDPVEDQVERYLTLLRERRLRLAYVAETHAPASGVSGAELLREATGARFVASDLGTPCADMIVRSDDVIVVGSVRVWVIATSDFGSVSYRVGRRVFTGRAERVATRRDKRRFISAHP